MQVLTPTGYVHPSALSNGAELCAFDLTTGAPIINHVESIDFVDYAEWCRWWQIEETVPPFNWVSINHGALVMFREQSVWRNDGEQYVHARSLEIGDVIYDDHDNPITVSHIEEYEDRDAVWYRFDVDGDHSYILDGLTVHNASRTWTGGTGSWTPSNTASWSGGAVPGSGDTATFDGTSGGGTVTLNFGGTITVQSITMGAFTGTWDNSVNNNNVTVTGSNTGFIGGNATGTRTIKLGTATYSITSTSGQWNFATTTNLTYTGNTGANIVFTGGVGTKIFAGGGLSHGNVTFGALSGGGLYQVTGASTFASLSISAPSYVQWPNSVTNTITGAFTFVGSPTSQIGFISNNVGTAATIAAAAGSTLSFCSLRDITFTGSPTTQNCVDLGNNSGVTINPPQVVQPTYAAGI